MVALDENEEERSVSRTWHSASHGASPVHISYARPPGEAGMPCTSSEESSDAGVVRTQCDIPRVA